MKNLEPEIMAMSKTYEALKNLDQSQIDRIINWVKDRFEILDNVIYVESERIVYSAPEERKDTKVTEVETEEDDLRKYGQKIIRVKPISKKPIGERGLEDYDTVLDLFAESNVKTINDKILLMAAFLQVRFEYKEISSYDLNFRLKRIGHGIPNISSALNSLLAIEPKVFEEIGRGNEGKAARRRFTVTPEGLRIAEKFLQDSDNR